MECVKCKKSIPEDALFCQWCGKKQTSTPRKRKKRANGMGTVIKKPGNRSKPWEAQKGGIYVGCYATRFEAEQALAKLVDVRMSETFNMTFSQIYKKWKPTHDRTITEAGKSGYEFAYKHCEPLYDKVFRKLRTSDFQEVINRMELDGLSKSSCGKVVQLFGQLSKWAIQEEICHTNYAQFVVISATQKSEKVPFTTEQIQAIRKALSPARDVALILISTGCRPNELFSATLENCHDGYFISGSKTEAGKNRVIPVSSLGHGAYSRLRQAAEKSGGELLIDGYTGNKEYRNFAKRDWKKLMDETKISGMSPYNCRHTYSTLAVLAGVKPEILQKIMGHADYGTTLGVYTHLGIDEILKESQKILSADLSVTENK